MTALIRDITSYLAKRLLHYRNYPFLQEAMAACALGDVADGEMPMADQIQMVRLYGELGVKRGDYKSYAGPG